jgi:hypothetical protein
MVIFRLFFVIFVGKATDRFKRSNQGNLKERGHCGDTDVDGRIILRWIFRKLEWAVGTRWSWLRIRTGGGHL